MFPLSTQNVVIIGEDNHPSSVHVEESISIDSDTSAGSYDISTTGNISINSSTIDTFDGEGISPIYTAYLLLLATYVGLPLVLTSLQIYIRVVAAAETGVSPQMELFPWIVEYQLQVSQLTMSLKKIFTHLIFVDFFDLKYNVFEIKNSLKKFEDGYKEILSKLISLQDSIHQHSDIGYTFDGSDLLCSSAEVSQPNESFTSGNFEFGHSPIDLFSSCSGQQDRCHTSNWSTPKSSTLDEDSHQSTESTISSPFPVNSGKKCLSSLEIKKSKLVATNGSINIQK